VLGDTLLLPIPRAALPVTLKLLLLHAVLAGAAWRSTAQQQ
jgi:hypothetical protein